jgi:hypothetical protein
MATVIIDGIRKRVTQPVAVIDNGEIEFVNLAASGHSISYRLIRTNAGIDIWVRSSGKLNRIATNFGLMLDKNVHTLKGKVILAGKTPAGNTEPAPLSEHQLGHIVRLAVGIRIPISAR